MKLDGVTHYHKRSCPFENLWNPILLAEETICNTDKCQPYMGVSTENKDLLALAVAHYGI